MVVKIAFFFVVVVFFVIFGVQNRLFSHLPWDTNILVIVKGSTETNCLLELLSFYNTWELKYLERVKKKREKVFARNPSLTRNRKRDSRLKILWELDIQTRKLNASFTSLVSRKRIKKKNCFLTLSKLKPSRADVAWICACALGICAGGRTLAAHYTRASECSMRCEGHDEKYLIYYKDLFSLAKLLFARRSLSTANRGSRYKALTVSLTTHN